MQPGMESQGVCNGNAHKLSQAAQAGPASSGAPRLQLLPSTGACEEEGEVCCSPGSAVVQVSSLGSWNWVGFLSMAAAMSSSKGRFRWGCPPSASAAVAESSSTSMMSSSTSFCSELGVSVLALEVGVPGRLALRSRSRVWERVRRTPPLARSKKSAASLVGDVVLFPDFSTKPLTWPSSFFCSRFCKAQNRQAVLTQQPQSSRRKGKHHLHWTVQICGQWPNNTPPPSLLSGPCNSLGATPQAPAWRCVIEL